MVKDQGCGGRNNMPRTLYIPKYPLSKRIKKVRNAPLVYMPTAVRPALFNREALSIRLKKFPNAFNETSPSPKTKIPVEKEKQEETPNKPIRMLIKKKKLLASNSGEYCQGKIQIDNTKVQLDSEQRPQANSLSQLQEQSDYDAFYYKKLFHRKLDDLKTFWLGKNKLFPHIFQRKMIKTHYLYSYTFTEISSDLSLKRIFC